MSEQKWNVGPVQLVDGSCAFIDAINDQQENFRYTGRYRLYGDWIAFGWDFRGRVMYSHPNDPKNLAPQQQKTEIEVPHD